MLFRSLSPLPLPLQVKFLSLHEAFPIIHGKYRIFYNIFTLSCLRKTEPLTCFWHLPVNWSVWALRACIFDQLACFLEPADEIVARQFTILLKLKKPASMKWELRPIQSKACQATTKIKILSHGSILQANRECHRRLCRKSFKSKTKPKP